MGRRICMVAYTHYDTDARPRRAAEALVARGDEVEFVALADGDTPRKRAVGGVRVLELGVQRYRGDAGLRYGSSYIRFFLRALAIVSRRHFARRYDVVYIHTMPDFMVFSALPSRLFGARVVLDIHDTMPELFQSKFGLGEANVWVRGLRLVERASCAFADRVICVHDAHRVLLERRATLAPKLTVVMNLPDPSVFGPRLAVETEHGNPEVSRVVYHGTISRRLGPDLAVDAFQAIAPRLPGARLQLFGTGDAADELAIRIERSGVADRIEFPGRRFQVDEVPTLVRGASVGIVPNRDDPATRLMLPVKLLEYVYLGVPVVAPRLPTVRHYFDDNAVAYFEPGNAADCARVLEDVLKSPARRNAMRAASAAFCERYSWERVKCDLYAAVDAA